MFEAKPKCKDQVQDQDHSNKTNTKYKTAILEFDGYY